MCSNIYSADHWSPVQSQWSHCIVETLCNTELLYIRGVRMYVVQSSCVHFTSWCLFDHVRVTSEPRRMDLILLNWVHLTLSWTVMLWLLDLYVVVLVVPSLLFALFFLVIPPGFLQNLGEYCSSESRFSSLETLSWNLDLDNLFLNWNNPIP